MRRGLWVWTRLAVAAAILTVLIGQLGTGPFLEGLRRIDGWSVAAAAAIAVPTTVACAWRWRLVSGRLGTDLPLREAVSAYYQSQFLNTVLPGGVLGDVHRAVHRGRRVGDVGHGVRAVVWDRSSGQAVQVALTVAVLLVLPSPLRASMPAVAAVLLVIALAGVLLGRLLPRQGGATAARFTRAVISDLREGLLSRRAWPGVVLTSTVVVAGHAATFLIAAWTAGSTASAARLLPLALVVMLATGLPTNIAGWGPREGAAAWVFAAAGLGAAQGVATAVVYGVMALASTLPGAVVLATAWLRTTTRGLEPGPGGGGGPGLPIRPRTSATPEGVGRG